MNVKELGRYKIVLKENACECNRYAADNLATYVKKVCGVDLIIVTDGEKVSAPYFSIGETSYFEKNKDDFDRKQLVSDGFRIFTDNLNNVYFDSLSPRGVMYAVFDFLEVELGVKFLTARVEITNPKTEIDFSKINRVSIPDFEMRTYFEGDMPKNELYYVFYAKARNKEVYNIVPEKFGGGVGVYGRNTFHNFHFYCPFEKYGNAHPEWYRFIYVNESIYPTIDITNGITEDGKLDETMEFSVAKAVIDEFKIDVDTHPDVEVFTFTQEDGPYYFDDDNNRRLEKKFMRSGILIRFVNVIAAEVAKYAKEKYDRKVRFMTFGYSYASEPPVKLENGKYVPLDKTVICSENVIIQLALCGNCCYSYFDERQDKEVLQIINKWHAVCNQFWFWGYDLDYAHYHNFFDSFDIIGDNVRGFKDLGITYLFMEAGEGLPYALWQSDVKAYVYNKMLWDSSLDENVLLNEFLDLFYGVAADKIREFIALFHNNYKTLNEQGRNVRFYTRWSCEDVENNPLSMLLKGKLLLEEAEVLIKNAKLSAAEEKDMLRRIAQVKLTPYKMIYNKFYEYYPNASAKERIALRDEYKQVVKDCDEPDILSGSHWTMGQYFDEMDGIFGKKEEAENK